jgi:hypothetical protein
MKAKLALAVLATALAAPAAAQPGPGPGGDYEQYRQQMWARMQTMHEQMDKIRATTDPKEREKLLREHYESMQQGMGMMRGYGPMMGGPGPGYGPGYGMGMGPGAGKGPGAGPGAGKGPGTGPGPGVGKGPGAGPGPGGGMMGRGFGRGPYVASVCTKLDDPGARRDCILEERLDIMQDMINQLLDREGLRPVPRAR